MEELRAVTFGPGAIAQHITTMVRRLQGPLAHCCCVLVGLPGQGTEARSTGSGPLNGRLHSSCCSRVDKPGDQLKTLLRSVALPGRGPVARELQPFRLARLQNDLTLACLRNGSAPTQGGEGRRHNLPVRSCFVWGRGPVARDAMPSGVVTLLGAGADVCLLGSDRGSTHCRWRMYDGGLTRAVCRATCRSLAGHLGAGHAVVFLAGANLPHVPSQPPVVVPLLA